MLQEAQTHLNNREHYKPLENAMAVETLQRVNELVTRLHRNNYIDDMTKKWFSQTRNPPRILIFYPQTKSGRKTDYFGLRRPYRKTIVVCGQITTADCTDTEIVS